MSPTSESINHGAYRGEIVTVDFVSDQSPFFFIGRLPKNGSPGNILFLDSPKSPEPDPFAYLGEIFSPTAVIEQMMREVLIPELARNQFPRPPEHLGRSIPARQQPVRGARLSCGGWR